ncbi:hypothetical protein [Pseudosulfitobacter sp. DSM 107133]|uniref:hypothetical protein n=1 Tax=Pseudosulfitobacter sp. DSM 107133 TaxID=2883100 RepID=UPI0013B41EEF|nr:hypothetical protein [Pseudosulfitobacter sp. DSM 107133]
MDADCGENQAEWSNHCGFTVFLRQLWRFAGGLVDSNGIGLKIVSACNCPLD